MMALNYWLFTGTSKILMRTVNSSVKKHFILIYKIISPLYKEYLLLYQPLWTSLDIYYGFPYKDKKSVVDALHFFFLNLLELTSFCLKNLRFFDL
jgi:hypothetical protein